MATLSVPMINSKRPSTCQLIEALAQHAPLFEHIDKHPQSSTHNRFGKNWSRSLNYIESEVHRCSDAVDAFLWKNSNALAEKELRTELDTVLKDELEMLILHWKVVKASGEMAIAPSQSKVSMDEFRSESGCEGNITRAANGEFLSLYGQMGEPVPEWCATNWREDLDPADEGVAKWLMDPLVSFIGKPFSILLFNIPPIRKRLHIKSPDIKFFSSRTVVAITRTGMVMFAILCATAAIFTLDVVGNRQLRIFVMALYALVFALPVQFLAPSSLPLYTLIISFFQTMVLFVGSTREADRCQ